MNKNWDYILEESEYHRTLFRVYPKWTFIHSFDEEPPNNWKDVYKVYYSWAIIYQYKDDNGNIKNNRKLMRMHCDCIYMLPGWEKSRGAKHEHSYAVTYNLEVIMGKGD